MHCVRVFLRLIVYAQNSVDCSVLWVFENLKKKCVCKRSTEWRFTKNRLKERTHNRRWITTDSTISVSASYSLNIFVASVVDFNPIPTLKSIKLIGAKSWFGFQFSITFTYYYRWTSRDNVIDKRYHFHILFDYTNIQ